VSPSIDSQRLPKVGMDVLRPCRLDGHATLFEEMNKVTADRQIAISNFLCVPGGLQMSTELGQTGMNLHEHLLGDFQGVPCRPGSDYVKQKSPRSNTRRVKPRLLRIIRSFT
jgi:hypothetical protein